MVKTFILVMYALTNNGAAYAPPVYFDTISECKTKERAYNEMASKVGVSLRTGCYPVVPEVDATDADLLGHYGQ